MDHAARTWLADESGRAAFIVATLLGAVALVGAGTFAANRFLTTDAGADAIAPFQVGIGEPIPVPVERISAAATTALLPDGNEGSFGPNNTIDGDLETAWNSDARSSNGQGQVLTYRFSEPVDLKSIRFLNGSAQSPRAFAANHRIRELLVRTDSTSQAITLLDMRDEQEVTFEFGLTSKVEIEVIDFYQGDGFDNQGRQAELSLSEIQFIAVQRDR